MLPNDFQKQVYRLNVMAVATTILAVPEKNQTAETPIYLKAAKTDSDPSMLSYIQSHTLALVYSLFLHVFEVSKNKTMLKKSSQNQTWCLLWMATWFQMSLKFTYHIFLNYVQTKLMTVLGIIAGGVVDMNR